MKVAVVYWTGSGNTEAMADEIIAKAAEAGAEVENVAISDFDEAKVADYDAVALGCPAMGAEELEDGEFLPMYETVKPALSGKKVALFGSYGWGDGEWMRTWEADAKEAGADLYVDSLIVNEYPDDEGLALCAEFGKALAG